MNPVIANALVSFEPGLFIWVGIAFLAFLWLLKKFAWVPLLNALDEREKNIQESLDSAEKAMKKAEEIAKKNDEALKEAEIAAQRLRKQAKEEAEKLRADILENAREDAEKLKEQTLSAIQQEKKKALVQLRDQVAELAIEASQKILKTEIDKTKNEKLVNDFLEDLSSN